MKQNTQFNNPIICGDTTELEDTTDLDDETDTELDDESEYEYGDKSNELEDASLFMNSSLVFGKVKTFADVNRPSARLDTSFSENDDTEDDAKPIIIKGLVPKTISASTNKALVLFFPGMGFKHSMIDRWRSDLRNSWNCPDVRFYGEDQYTESLDWWRLVRFFSTASPIERSVESFVDIASTKFKEGAFDKVICLTHSFGACILSKFLEAMNKKYKDNPQDEDFKKFYQSFSDIFMNRPFVSNKFNDLNGAVALGSLVCGPVETNKEAIKEFVKNNTLNTKLTLTLAEQDKVITYKSQQSFASNLEVVGVNIPTVKKDEHGHDNYYTVLPLLKQKLHELQKSSANNLEKREVNGPCLRNTYLNVIRGGDSTYSDELVELYSDELVEFDADASFDYKDSDFCHDAIGQCGKNTMSGLSNDNEDFFDSIYSDFCLEEETPHLVVTEQCVKKTMSSLSMSSLSKSSLSN